MTVLRARSRWGCDEGCVLRCGAGHANGRIARIHSSRLDVNPVIIYGLLARVGPINGESHMRALQSRGLPSPINTSLHYDHLGNSRRVAKQCRSELRQC